MSKQITDTARWKFFFDNPKAYVVILTCYNRKCYRVVMDPYQEIYRYYSSRKAAIDAAILAQRTQKKTSPK